MAFEFHQKVLFRHCDAAGIVFYPRYFEMMNDCVEAFFDQALKTPLEELHKTAAIPTAQIETQFSAPSRHGDDLSFALVIKKVGRSSAAYVMTAHCQKTLRFTTTATLVYVNGQGRPTPWPDALRENLTVFKDPQT